MLSHTDVKELGDPQSKEISQSLTKFCKSKELRRCHLPYLSLILLAEFLKKLAKADVLHQNILAGTMDVVLDLAYAL